MMLGAVWSLAEPLGILLILSLVFGYIIRVDTGGLPYPLFAFSGLVGWWIFSKTTTAVSTSLLDNIGVISKVYFPRIILPLAAVGRELFDAAILSLILVGISLAYGYVPGPQILLLPLVFIAASLIGLGFGLILAPLTVKFRDVRHILALILQAGMYATPIVYSPSLVPEAVRTAYEMNPLYWVVGATRWMLIGTPLEITIGLWFAAALALIVLCVGFTVFARLERISVDVQ
jgi:lipopolysaccharide transport system permease protein